MDKINGKYFPFPVKLTEKGINEWDHHSFDGEFFERTRLIYADRYHDDFLTIRSLYYDDRILDKSNVVRDIRYGDQFINKEKEILVIDKTNIILTHNSNFFIDWQWLPHYLIGHDTNFKFYLKWRYYSDENERKKFKLTTEQINNYKTILNNG